MNDKQRVERVLTDRLMTGTVTLRVLALSLWAVFAIIYWGVAPWWMVAVPCAVHVAAMTGFILLSRAYRIRPESRTIGAWRRDYIFYAGLTGLPLRVRGRPHVGPPVLQQPSAAGAVSAGRRPSPHPPRSPRYRH